MARHLDALDLIAILTLVIFMLGSKVGGRSWQEMADVVAQAIQRFRQGDPQAQLEAATVRDLTVLAIGCMVLALELSWLATQL